MNLNPLSTFLEKEGSDKALALKEDIDNLPIKVYHGSPKPHLKELYKGSYVTTDPSIAHKMGRFYKSTGKTWKDDDLAERYGFTPDIKFKEGREPDGEPTVYEGEIHKKDIDFLNNPHEHKTLIPIPIKIYKMNKTSSAHFADVKFSSLPSKTQEDIKRFASDITDDTLLIHAGYVIKELLPMVDKHNFDQAEKHIKDTKIDEKEFYKLLPSKYILIKDNKIIDGHHYVAKARKLGVTCSLNVLDLTPIRFQKKAANLWEVLKNRIS